MKTIDAKWDEYITGLRTCEIIFDKRETIQNYINTSVETEYQFIVVKVPIGNLKLVHDLESIGYRYLENQISLTFEVDQLEFLNPVWERLLNNYSHKLITSEQEVEAICEKVNDKMFDNDRYSQDPFWGKETSSKRYINWILELYNSNHTKVYSMIKNGNEVGFFTVKKISDSINSCPIAGIFNSYKYSGYIYALVRDILLITKEMDARKFITSISSNNQNLLSSFSKIFTYKVSNTSIVLRKVI